MSRFIATAAIKGAHSVVQEVGKLCQETRAKLGPEAPVAFPNTAYYLPVIYGYTGHKVSKMADLKVPLEYAKGLLPAVPRERVWLPYLGGALDAGGATVFAEGGLGGLRFARGE